MPLPATSWLLLAGFVGLVANRRKLGDPVAALPTVVDLHA
ncbi:VPLPA-CTERM sorting domain-containing protein [Nitrosovibrio sp. Nv17]|nr:VPLPA-CTERM sorting domain-containing protein [Nitrosovibrio sp. Nv17]